MNYIKGNVYIIQGMENSELYHNGKNINVYKGYYAEIKKIINESYVRVMLPQTKNYKRIKIHVGHLRSPIHPLTQMILQ